ncbi:FG-GAP-like repeat-containing protein [Pontibacter sp. CAU 1760]
MKQYLILLYLFFSALTTVMAQQAAPLQFRFRQDVPVSSAGRQLQHPWSGGLNTPQFSTLDLNLDGQPDLFVFDRQLQKVFTWLAVQQNGQWQYTYAPAYEALFPADLEKWALLRDYNCDGLKDIFTSSPLGIRVYKQERSSSGMLKFSLAEEALFYSNGRVNMQMQSADIPAITDIDNDGDLDILITEFSRGFTLELYRNQQVENKLTCGSLAYEQQTTWWGGITECDGCNNYVFGAYCRVAGPLHTGHEGSALLLLDMDADGDKDLVMGSVQCHNLVLMENKGTATQAQMTGYTPAFPATAPMTLKGFPAAYYEDVTFDGVPDMLVAPQATQDLQGINFENATWLYHNQGAANRPDFQFLQDDFLQGQMIDVGEGAFPAFADLDGDGDLDMLVSNAAATRGNAYSAALHVYRNTGTAAAPAFTLETNDYLGLQQAQLFNLHPAFADLNGDGALDLVLGYKLAARNTSRISYIPNKAAKGQPAQYNFGDVRQLLTVPDNASPAFVDIDADGDQDLLLGQSDGSLSFYQNTGTSTAPAYTAEVVAFGGILPDYTRRLLAPATADVDGDGVPDLLTTDDSGTLRIYRNLPGALTGATLTAETEVLGNQLLAGLQATRLGKGLHLTTANLGEKNTLHIIIGTQGGGLYMLEQTGGNTNQPANPESSLTLAVYPNPVDRSGSGNVQVKASAPVSIQVFDAIGRLVYERTGMYSRTHTLPMQHLKSGIYIIRGMAESGQYVCSKLVVR